jgi:hypothetical protein
MLSTIDILYFFLIFFKIIKKITNAYYIISLDILINLLLYRNNITSNKLHHFLQLNLESIGNVIDIYYNFNYFFYFIIIERIVDIIIFIFTYRYLIKIIIITLFNNNKNINKINTPSFDE